MRLCHGDIAQIYYAEFELMNGICPLLAESGLYNLQLEKGHKALPEVCRTFPRSERYYHSGYLQQSLSPACEAVLDLLWNLPDGIEFRTSSLPADAIRNLSDQNPSPMLSYAYDIQSLCIDILQDRRLPLSQRIILMGARLQELTKENYISFSQKMKPYIRPRIGGVKKLEWFLEGFENYIRDAGGNALGIKLAAFSGENSYEEARAMICTQIDAGCPIPYLLLKHKRNEKYKDYIWHWFLLVGYEEKENDILVKTATYGESCIFPLRELWDTGCMEKGGMIRLSISENRLSPKA